jgi:exodeoxyribonuclease VII small subunit
MQSQSKREISMTKNMNFEQAMIRLSEIIETLERNGSDLESSIELFEEGLNLVKQCDKQLKNFETKVSELMVKYNDDTESK